MNIKNRTLYIADNLDILRNIDSETIDLIYCDPPFNTKKHYETCMNSEPENFSFRDIWTDEDVQQEQYSNCLLYTSPSPRD